MLNQVNRAFNNLGKDCLNKGLIAVEKFRNLCLREVKIQLPRRESERRVHPLARHVDVLMAIETRISMLSMTYGKYIDSGLCCFIPGKVLSNFHFICSKSWLFIWCRCWTKCSECWELCVNQKAPLDPMKFCKNFVILAQWLWNTLMRRCAPLSSQNLFVSAVDEVLGIINEDDSWF